jgi:hypothetical protein
MWFGVAAAVLVVMGAIAFGVAAWRGAALDRESKAYADESVLAITKTWSEEELAKRASPNLRNTTTPAQIGQMFNVLRNTLGPLSTYDGSGGQSVMTVGTNAGTRANYSGKGHFQKGDADIQLMLIKDGDTWMIEGFHVNSPVLMNKMTEPKT